MATLSSTLAWRIPWIKESGRLQSQGRKESDTTERPHSLTEYAHILFLFCEMCNSVSDGSEN